MKITPLEIDGHQFGRRFRGYDPEDVRAFLTLVSEEYEKLVVENHKLRDDMSNMQSILDEHRQREKILRETLFTAQRVSEDLKEQARREGEIVVREAQLKADQILESTQERAARLEASLSELRTERKMFLRKIRAIVGEYQKLLELQEQQAIDEGKVKLLQRKGAAKPS